MAGLGLAMELSHRGVNRGVKSGFLSPLESRGKSGLGICGEDLKRSRTLMDTLH